MVKKIAIRLLKLHYKRKVAKSVASYQEPLRVNKKTRLTSNTHLKSNANFNGLEIAGNGTVTIGNNFHSGRGCLLITANHDYDHGDAIPYDSQRNICKSITIEDNVWLGDRVIVLGGVTIGEGAIIQAGSVVVNSIPKYAIAGGHPDKVFKQRDIRHYETLKVQGKFT